jgi:hypothetical protein
VQSRQLLESIQDSVAYIGGPVSPAIQFVAVLAKYLNIRGRKQLSVQNSPFGAAWPAEAAGLDPLNYAGHSLRAGMSTQGYFGNGTKIHSRRRLKSVDANVSIERHAARRNRAAGEQSPFGVEEVETMSRTLSTSSNKPCGVAR